MADMCKCLSQGCPQKALCLRFNARGSDHQSFGNFFVKGKRCEYFIPMKNNEKKPNQEEVK